MTISQLRCVSFVFRETRIDGDDLEQTVVHQSTTKMISTLGVVLAIVGTAAYLSFVQKWVLEPQLVRCLQKLLEREEEVKAKHVEALVLANDIAIVKQELRARIQENRVLGDRITELEAERKRSESEVVGMRLREKELSASMLRKEAERAREIKELRVVVDAMEVACSQKDDEIRNRADEALARTIENEDLRRKIEEAVRRSSDLENKLAGVSDENRKRGTELEAADLRNRKTHERNILLSSNLLRQGKEIEGLKQGMKEAHDGCSLKDVQILAKDCQVRDLHSENRQLQRKILHLRREIEDIVGQLTAAEVEARMREVEVAEVRSRDKAQYMSLLMRLATRETEIRQLRTRLESVEAQDRSKDDQIRVLKATGEGQEQEVLVLTDKLKECMERLNNNSSIAGIDFYRILAALSSRSGGNDDGTDSLLGIYFSEPEPGMPGRPSSQTNRAIHSIPLDTRSKS
ncbi:hypothetical protein NMY22_g8905 [Coprinellus aureogranulatus]|nr:hypothetical protein NMY22_g8905 [Coprinellus aureogranulatus]